MRLMERKLWRGPLLVLSVVALTLAAAGEASGERLPVKSYTSADGLPFDVVARIVQDRHGFIWFCTPLGLSRFDGYRFTNYGVEEGLPFSSVNYFLETREGDYWAATNGAGVCRFNPLAAQAPAASREGARFTVYRVGDEPASNRVNALYEDSSGRIWAGTDGGLFFLDEAADAFIRVELRIAGWDDRFVQLWTFIEDGEGSLWMGSTAGLTRRLPDGRFLSYSTQMGKGRNNVFSLVLADERLWMGTEQGLVVLKPDPAPTARAREFAWQRLARTGAAPRPSRKFPELPDAPGDASVYNAADGLGGDYVRHVSRAMDGRILIGMREAGLVVFDGRAFRRYTTANGLTENDVLSILEDRDGNLWLGTSNSGAMKLSRNGFITYNQADGLGHDNVLSIFEAPAGELYAVTGEWRINRFDGERFTSVRPNLPPQILVSEWRRFRCIMRDREGEWWVATSKGLLRYPKVERLEQLAKVPPKAFYTKEDGLVENNVTQMFEDSRGDIWIGHWAGTEEVATQWERATGKFRRFGTGEGLPPFNPPMRFYEDASNNLWFALRNGGLARYREGRFRLFTAEDGMPAGVVVWIAPGSADGFWIITNTKRLTRISDLSAENPRLVTYEAFKGPASDHSAFVIEDNSEGLYIGMPNGIDRFDPTTGKTRHYTLADGFPAGGFVAHRDRAGVFWFGTPKGIVKFAPEPDRPSQKPPVFVSGLHIVGVAQPISDLGETSISGLELGPDQNQIQVDYFALSLVAGESLRYQYLLEGSGQDWSAPTDQRTVNLNLAPGSYRLLVRAISSDGAISPEPAAVSFSILPPVWQRWWFLTLAVAAVGAAVYLVDRYRVARLLELERVRTRIATDLHDDIGASLSRMAILSEVVKQQTRQSHQESAGLLTEIADSARGLVDSMSDIVWSIDPRKDDLANVVSRIRQFASDIFEAEGIDWRFEVPEDIAKTKLPPDERRHIFLIFKEAINNIARHAGARTVRMCISLTHRKLEAEIGDDGRGFAAESLDEAAKKSRGGNGLKNMRARAAELGGRLDIDSAAGGGTRLSLSIPLKSSQSRWARKAGA